MKNFIREKIRTTCQVLKEHEKENVFQVSPLMYIPSDYKKPGEMPELTEEWQEFGRHDRVHGRDQHFWFRTEIDVPEDEEGQDYVLELITGHEGDWDATNPQGLLYLNGVPVCGYDINHREYILKGGQHYEVLLYFYVGMIESYVEVQLDVNRVHKAIRDLYFDMQVPYEAALCYPEEEYTSIRICKYLELACNLLDLRVPGSQAFYASAEAASKYLKEEFYEKECGNCDAIVSYVGHTHIDVAWLWTLAQTREKVQRTFSTMLYLMDRYPEFVFFSSQPQLFKYLKEEAPVLYEQVKERVKEGRFEVDGAMWLEADCNLSSGESLIRQIAHGKHFMKDEFGVDSKILWLPDVFGYSAAVPQILKKTGVSRFVTSKISWNESNVLPYDSFLWQGIDGSEVFTYFLTAQNSAADKPSENHTTYNGEVTPKQNIGTWKRYQQKEYSNEVINTFGFGDGGGGTTYEMLEGLRRLSYGLPGQPISRISRAGDFLDRVEKSFLENAALLQRTPRWVGELYLEFHRGTYTSTAQNKRNNRFSEFLLENAETTGVMAELLKGKVYPAEELYNNWEKILLNQFHDIIPGSSIFEVYEDSDKDYAAIRESAGKIFEENLKSLSGEGEELLVYNPNGFTGSGYIQDQEGRYVYVDQVPGFGVSKVTAVSEASDGLSASLTGLETPYYSIEFDASFRITRLFDKENRREVTVSGETMNLLRSYENYPYEYDNWELSSYHLQKYWDVEEVVEAVPFIAGGACGVKVTWKYGSSTITQTIRAYEKSRRIDFETEADWHEDHQMLKALFPVDIRSEEALYEVQYGHVKRPTHRNTSWDQAKFEVCAQKWMDLSETGYGVSLLNDCKYGHSCLGNLMTISLIKTGTYPNPVSGLGYHKFTYALLPHKDSIREAGTVQEAYRLNRPLISLKGSSEQQGLISADADNIIIECVKKAYDGNGIVVRLYDAWNTRKDVNFSLSIDAKGIYLADMLENPLEKIGEGRSFTAEVGGFEIVTLLIRL